MHRLPHSHGRCPVNVGETAEAYIMKRLPTAHALQFALHFLRCPRCAEAVEEAERFVGAIKVAAKRLKAESGNGLRICSRASITSIAHLPPRAIRAQMRFEVTVCDAPHNRCTPAPSELRWPPSGASE